MVSEFCKTATISNQRTFQALPLKGILGRGLHNIRLALAGVQRSEHPTPLYLNVLAGDLAHRARAALAHRQQHLGVENIEHALDAGLPEGAQSP